jgi:hypothetical protein
VTFTVDTGTEHTVITTSMALFSGNTTANLGAMGTWATKQPFCQASYCEIGSHKVHHEFLYMPDCPIPLLGWDILSKLGAQITFKMMGLTTLEINTNPQKGIPSLWPL